MKNVNNTELYAEPESIRIFWGYKLSQVSLEQFHKELGETFMPGTPAILGPMGLNGYLPAVLNKNETEKYPDEVALIVYPTLELYEEARRDNLLGRIYTYSHMGVFDMARSGGQWPGPVESPTKHGSSERWSWRTFDQPLDWQKGQARLLVLESETVNLFDFLQHFTQTQQDRLRELGIEEMIVQCTNRLATIWLYSMMKEMAFAIESLGILDKGIIILNDLMSQPFYFRSGKEKATIQGETFLQFRFSRDNRFYL